MSPENPSFSIRPADTDWSFNLNFPHMIHGRRACLDLQLQFHSCELEKRLPTDDEIVVPALGDVKYDVLRYLNNRKALEILKLETRYMKKRDKGAGLKAIVRSRIKPNNFQKL
jgi:hypothetical protein